jgi:hypothetical protein
VRKLAEAEVPPQITGERRQILERALQESFVYSFRVTTLIAALLALLSVVCAWATIDPRVADTQKSRARQPVHAT